MVNKVIIEVEADDCAHNQNLNLVCFSLSVCVPLTIVDYFQSENSSYLVRKCLFTVQDCIHCRGLIIKHTIEALIKCAPEIDKAYMESRELMGTKTSHSRNHH